ncbi:hypothetical protein CPB83DRAFT_907266 [Crepidotus variabilis]|uniref:E3 ubiquitin-protein ligase n=1 Tax=Crepidotus variabilis TaxID=179855 RepID=A0A9P6JPK2_9AGAR|nr:hypothetical protein CPB83DRAFT_907266 [Crepidotus variabilis]
MSSLSSFFPTRRPPQSTNNPPPPSSSTPHSTHPQDPLSDLRFSLEIMPGSRKYMFTPSARAEILEKVYRAFVGGVGSVGEEMFFGPRHDYKDDKRGRGPEVKYGLEGMKKGALLGEWQRERGMGGFVGGKECEWNTPSGEEDERELGRTCSHIFKKGESCYRCKDCALDDSCVLCSHCFHATNHTTHNVSFFIAQQSGGCCDCNDPEAWRVQINCPYHPPLPFPSPSSPSNPPTAPPLLPLPLPSPHLSHLPPTASLTLAYILDYILSILDYSPDEPVIPTNEAELRLQPSADPMMKDTYCVVLWNDDKHSEEEVRGLVAGLIGVGGAGGSSSSIASASGSATSATSGGTGSNTTGATSRDAPDLTHLTQTLQSQGRTILLTSSHIPKLLDIAQSLAQVDLGVSVRRAYDTFQESVVGVLVEWVLDLGRVGVWVWVGAGAGEAGGGERGVNEGGKGKKKWDTRLIRELIAIEMLSPRKKDSFTSHLSPGCALYVYPPGSGSGSSGSGSSGSGSSGSGSSGSTTGGSTANSGAAGSGGIAHQPPTARLPLLLLAHTRLPRAPRLALKETYASLISLSSSYPPSQAYPSVSSHGSQSLSSHYSQLSSHSPQSLTYPSPSYKLHIATHFSSVYHRLIDSYLMVDREAETSIKYFALQLFTVGSVGGWVVQGGGVVVGGGVGASTMGASASTYNIGGGGLQGGERHTTQATIQRMPGGGMIERLLKIIEGFFMNQIIDKRIVYAPSSGLVCSPGVGAGGYSNAPVGVGSGSGSLGSGSVAAASGSGTGSANAGSGGGSSAAGSAAAATTTQTPNSNPHNLTPSQQSTLSLKSNSPIDPDSFPFKSKRFMPVFSDLRYLCNTRVVRGIIGGSTLGGSTPPYLSLFTQTCTLFMCLNPNKRAVETHVEYETDAWISVFNVTLSLSRVIRVFGEAFGVGEVGEEDVVGVGGVGGEVDTSMDLEGRGHEAEAEGTEEEEWKNKEMRTRALIGAIETVLHHILLTITMQATPPRLDANKFAPPKFHTVTFGSFASSSSSTTSSSSSSSSSATTPVKSTTTYTIVEFDVSTGWVSFHHSLHWLLAELFKHTGVLGDERLERVGYKNGLKEVVAGLVGERGVLGVVDYPLRVLAMIAQIRTGLWVRNGFAIRGQLLHYRDYMLRELCYDQDLFILQTSLVLLPPDLILISILDRFGLREYFDGDIVGALRRWDGESTHIGGMVEEVFYVLGVVVKENGSAGGKNGTKGSGRSIEKAIRREIVHALAPGPCAYSDLVKRVSERLVEDRAFDKVLKVVGNFKMLGDSSSSASSGGHVGSGVGGGGGTETGIWELKDGCYDEVDPFFYHYTRNRREEVETVLKKRAVGKARKKMGAEAVVKGETVKEEDVLKEWDVVIEPKGFGVKEGPYKDVSEVWEGAVLSQILFFAVWNVLSATGSDGSANPPPSAEAILDQAIHLAMVGVVERPQTFARKASESCWIVEGVEELKSFVEVLWLLASHEKYAKLYRARIEWVLDRVEVYVSSEVVRMRGDRSKSGNGAKDARKNTPGMDKEEERKRAAKKRQEMILEQMKQQQASFASTFGDVDSDEEDEDDEGDGSGSGEDGDDSRMLDAEGRPPSSNSKGRGKEREEKEEVVSFGTCIVCQEDLSTANMAHKPFGSLGLVQPSRLIRRHPDGQIGYLNDALGGQLSMDRTPPPAPGSSPGPTSFPPLNADLIDAKCMSPNFEGFPTNYTRFGLHSSVCTHLMHLECFQVYSVSIRQRHRTQATRNHPECIPRKEYICPLCKSLGNVILPCTPPDKKTQLNPVAFADWIRAAGIHILKSKPDPLLESLQFRNGTGEFVFWSAQDGGYASALRKSLEKEKERDGASSRDREKLDYQDAGKMLDTVMVVAKSISQQTRHLRDRMEPEASERGAGIYLPDELVGYTIASIEIQARGVAPPPNSGPIPGGTTVMVDGMSDSQMMMIRGLLSCLQRLAALQFRNRPDEGRDAVRQAIVKRLLPEWSRTSLTSFSYPLLLRDPFTILVETAAVAPEMLRHVLVLTFYACLARTVIGLVYILNKTRSHNAMPFAEREHQILFGDIRIFFLSVVRHSPVFEHTAMLAFDNFGEARIEKLLYTFSLQFLRRAAILCRAVLPLSFPTPQFTDVTENEYVRLLVMLGIPPLSDLPNHDTLQNALSGWCAHYGHSHASSQINCGVLLDYPVQYKLARLPLVLDRLFNRQDKALLCTNCDTFPVDAAICLICGTTVCMQSGCCVDEDYGNRGECNMHTRECGGTIGIYYCVKRCSILYINSGNGTFTPSPYLDQHGEVDLSMRRGRRQYLHQPRWEVIRKTWLSHGIPSIVARKLESTLDSGGWETL